MVLGTTLALTLAPLAPSWAQQAERRMFGGASPFTLDELPPGQLRRGLQQLPPQVRARALERLNRFGFPAADVARMRVDASGGVFYVDPPAEGEVPPEPESALPSGMGAAEVFALHSKPGASSTVFIDVDGHVISGTGWNSGDKPDTLYARPFDLDGDESAFDDRELDKIAEIWHRIAEDFAAFDIDVTTEEPPAFGPRTMHLLVTPNTDATGVPMPASDAGGVAYVNVFGSLNLGYYSPAFAYSNNVSNSGAFIAEVGSHEIGHNLGLSHDGTSSSSYFSGVGSGATSWGPIMGSSYNDNVSQWSRGEYPDANNTQDDIAIIGSQTGLREDDHADAFSAATPLVVGTDGSIAATTPETDPFGVYTANKGIIGTRTDVDMFGVDVGAGPTTLRVTPSWAAWPRAIGGNGRGTNLDVEATLYDAAGNVIARSDPLDETDAAIETTLAAGAYYLGIRGVGNAQSPYSDYGSQGQYFVTGAVTPGGSEPPPAADTTPPTPDPMRFAVAPSSLDESRIAMRAEAATDDSGGVVEYYFASPTGPDSGWIAATSYTATDLAPGTAYSWQVKARDAAGNETAPSAAAGASTDAPPPAPEPPAAVTTLSVTDNADGSATLRWEDAANESAYAIVRESWQEKRRRWVARSELVSLPADSTAYTDASGTGRYRYLVRVTNAVGGVEGAWVEVVVTDGDGGSCKGGPKKCGG